MKKKLFLISAAICLFGNIFAQTITATHTYDALHRLSKTSYSNGASISYTYDALGNRLSKITQASPLPVKWVSFTIKNNCHTVSLQWQTANEINNKLYVIEKSENAVDYNEIGKVEPNPSNNYLFNTPIITSSLDNKTIYYRIKQVDFDGKFSYSTVNKLDLNCKEKSISIFPNPAEGKLFIVGLTLSKNNIVVTDVYGKTIIALTNTLQKQVDISILTSGVYFIKVNDEDVLKFIKQ